MKNEEKTPIRIRLAQDSGMKKGDKLAVYIVDESGKVVEVAPLDGFEASLTSTIDAVRGRARVYIAPALPKELSTADINERKLLKVGAFNVVKKMSGNVISVPRIPGGVTQPWPMYNCLIKGHINKDFIVDGQKQSLPICNARVHICEVESELFPPHVPILWRRIPDWIIVEISEEFKKLRKVIKPPHITPDPPPPIDLGSDLTDARLRSLSTAISVGKSKKAASLPELPIDVMNGMTSGNIDTIRQTMYSFFQSLFPYFCLWPKYWPWLYSWDEETVVTTDCNGYFQMWENTLTEDGPLNLYIWVEVCINGEWVTVYKPPISCHTLWNYSCNTDINITLYDPRVIPCSCDTPLHGEIVWFKSIGESATASHIQQDVAHVVTVQGTGIRNVGCSDLIDSHQISPFGKSLYFKIQFGDLLPSTEITHYRWRKTRIRDANLNLVSGASSVIGGEVRRYYYVITQVNGQDHFETHSVALGAEGSGENIGYRIPCSDIHSDPGIPNPSDPSLQWTNPDFWSASIDSNSLDDGLYRFDLELLRLGQDGVFQVVPVPKSVFQISYYFDAGQSVNAPDEYLSFNSGNGIMNINDPKAFSLSLKVRIDNQPCIAEIDDALLTDAGGTPLQDSSGIPGSCGFIHYTDINQKIHISFVAAHPRNFATFAFSVTKGNGTEGTGVNVPSSLPAHVISSVDGFTLAGGVFSMNVPISQLLGTCSQAAFSENLKVYSLATDGMFRLIEYDRGDVEAFALSKS
jgi:hypothetical protein